MLRRPAYLATCLNWLRVTNMEKLTVVKIGGQIIDDRIKLGAFLHDFAAISEPKILVHGGGKSAAETLRKMGIKPRMAHGRRITDEATLEVVTMVYGGLINKNITARLQAEKCLAVGMSGADGDTILAVKRPVRDIDYGFAGDVVRVNGHIIERILNSGLTPVFCALTHDGKGRLLNTNADTIAAVLAGELSKRFDVDLIYCFEKTGVLKNIDDDESLIRLINGENYAKYKEDGIISAGMIPKIDNAFDSLNQGVKNVYITHFETLKNRNFEKGRCTRITLSRPEVIKNSKKTEES